MPPLSFSFQHPLSHISNNPWYIPAPSKLVDIFTCTSFMSFSDIASGVLGFLTRPSLKG